MTHLTIQTVREVMKAMLESPCFDRVANKHTNRGGTLHGGLTATLVDIVSTAALVYTERGVPGVSVDMNITQQIAGLHKSKKFGKQQSHF
ncbi:hypothetical protein E2320_011172 [Naja naja]|nr:hypothetical protein E2320_011172 [Naja naja]